MMNQDHAANVAAKVPPGVPPGDWRRTALDAAPGRTDSAGSAPSVRPSPWSMDGRRQNAVVRRADLRRSDKFSQILSHLGVDPASNRESCFAQLRPNAGRMSKNGGHHANQRRKLALERCCQLFVRYLLLHV